MAKSSGQKLKLLYLIKCCRENTDENHPMSTPDIIKYLENQGNPCRNGRVSTTIWNVLRISVMMWCRCRADWEAVLSGQPGV